MYEMGVATRTESHLKRVDSVKEKNKQDGDKVDGQDRVVTKFTRDELSLITTTVIYALWCLVGLFSSQWLLFVALLLLGLITGGAKVRIKSMRIRVAITAVDAVVSFAIILFIILNKFHFHINLWKELTS